jgi:Fic family protein
MASKSSARFRTDLTGIDRTHPWIKFEIDLKSAPARLWLALGEARSKCEHLAGVPLKPEVARRLHEIYLAKGVHATTAIEGNTLSEKQVLDRIAGKQVVPVSQQYLQREIDNIVKAANEILEKVEHEGHTPITPEDIKRYNKIILDGLELEEHVVPGEYRGYTVGVLDYVAPGKDYSEPLVREFCRWLNSADFTGGDDDGIVFGIVKSIVAHVYFAWIHPFGDGNGRTARLIEVRFLMESGVPSAAIHLLSDHYNRTRSEYYRRLAEASKNGGNLTNFLMYGVRGFVDQIRDQLTAVRAQQWGVAWQNFIYEIFGEERTHAEKRQIALLLALSTTDDFVQVNKLRHLNPRLAEMYAGKTPKTLTRDLNNLKRNGLIERSKKGIRARKEIILAFLPRVKKGDREKHFDLGKKMKEKEGHLQLDLLSLIDDVDE